MDNYFVKIFNERILNDWKDDINEIVTNINKFFFLSRCIRITNDEFSTSCDYYYERKNIKKKAKQSKKRKEMKNK